MSNSNVAPRQHQTKSTITVVPPAPPVAYSIDEFCAAHRISRAAIYNLWRDGLGPRWLHVGSRRIITVEAAQAWARAREAAAMREASEREAARASQNSAQA